MMTIEEMMKLPREELVKIIEETPPLNIGIFVTGGPNDPELQKEVSKHAER